MRNIPRYPKRRTCLFTWFFLLLIGTTVHAATIRGFVRDRSSRETIPGASVQIANTNIGTPANLDGFYILSNLSAGNYTLRFSAMGYALLTKTVTLDANDVKSLDVELEVIGVQQKEIEVIGEREENDEGRQTAKVSSVVIESQRIKNIPALAGEVDILRMIQAIPGVKSTSDISTGLNVRGGNSAMCLIQMDQSAVYNPSHMFGIFSTFNGDAVKHLQLMKGGFSAEYGGRAGSILEVVTKEGNRNETNGNVSLGIVSSRALIEGPLPGKQGSYALSGRRTYFDLILDPLRKNEDFKDLPDYYFYDANGKLNWDFNDKTTLTVAGYTGLDDMSVEAGDDDSRFKISTQWGNRTFASRLRHVVSTDAFLTFGYTYSRYASDFSIYNEGRQMMAFTNQFHDQMLRTDGEYHGISNHTLRTGIEAHRFSVVVKSMNEKTTQADINGHSWNIAHYLQDNWKLAPKLEMKYGLRWYWHEMGKWTKFDPRLAFVYHYNPMTRFKLAGGRYHQWIELINGDASGASFEIWVPNDGSISPMYSDQIVVGVEHDPTAEIDVTAEGYYTAMRDVNEYNSQIDRGTTMKSAFLKGEGNAYGAELMVRKKSGRMSGWIGYSLSWTRRKFPDTYINFGNWYYPRWDRRHDFVVVSTYEINDRWEISGQWKYNTGQGYTRALGTYTYHIPEYPSNFFNSENRRMLFGAENNYRFPADHRLDLSANYKHQFFGLPAILNISIYNVYSRRAIYYRDYNTDENPVKVTDVKLLPILPMVAYEVKF